MAHETLLPIPVGAGVPETSAVPPRASEFEDDAPELSAEYIEAEYLLVGTANCYAGPATGPASVVSGGHRYVTRVLARYPKQLARFSGRVVVEPFNTTYGVDRDALWIHVGAMLQAQGDAWIGISVRAWSAAELQRRDPARYADIEIPSNDFAWDMLRAIGTLVNQGGEQSPLHHLPVRHIYLGGYSQSAVDTATFAATFGALTRTTDDRPVYDGYFPACHAASLTPLALGAGLPRFEYAAMPPVGVPVIEIQPQTDVEGFTFEQFVNPGSASVRREDSDAVGDRFRLYEIAGAAHAAKIAGCDGNGSSFPMSAFVRAALRHLFRWAEDDIAPPRAPRIALTIDDVVAEAAVDRFGNAVGGVPSPFLEVPIARYEAHSTPGPLCKLAGREELLPYQVLVERHGDMQSHLAEFTSSLGAAIKAGFLLDVDRATLLEAQTAKAQAAFAASAKVPWEVSATETSVPVPDSLEQALSPQWLTAVLQQRFPGVEVCQVIPGPVVDRISTNARFVIKCADGVPDGLSPALCVKGYFNETGRAACYIGAPEAGFYRDLATATGVRTLTSVYADIDQATRHGVVITEDVVSQGATFLDGNSRYTPDQTAQTLAEFARLHAATWADPACADAEWLAPRLGRVLDVWGPSTTIDVIKANLEGPNGRRMPDEVRDAYRLVDAYRGLIALTAAETATKPWCVIHGDAHVGNLFLDADLIPSVVDWQLVQRGMWYLDVGYHIASTLTVDERRSAERDLLRHYLAALASHGVTPPPWDEAWRAIAFGMVHGFFLWGITTKVQPAIIATLLHRLGTAVADRDALSLPV
jgi:hypothetical protein